LARAALEKWEMLNFLQVYSHWFLTALDYNHFPRLTLCSVIVLVTSISEFIHTLLSSFWNSFNCLSLYFVHSVLSTCHIHHGIHMTFDFLYVNIF
jgi:hypothetical protein